MKIIIHHSSISHLRAARGPDKNYDIKRRIKSGRDSSFCARSGKRIENQRPHSKEILRYPGGRRLYHYRTRKGDLQLPRPN